MLNICLHAVSAFTTHFAQYPVAHLQTLTDAKSAWCLSVMTDCKSQKMLQVHFPTRHRKHGEEPYFQALLGSCKLLRSPGKIIHLRSFSVIALRHQPNA